VFRYLLEIPDTARPQVALTLRLGGEELDRVTTQADGGRALELMLPVWTPGSYLVREYSRHVQQFTAAGEHGTALRWHKCAKNRYRVAIGGERAVELRWLVYAHELTVRTADVSPEFAVLNGACLFLWPVLGMERRATVELQLPAGWQLACPLLRGGITAARTAALAPADLRQLVDAPMLAGPLDVRAFRAAGVEHRFICAGLGDLPLPDALLADTTRVVEQAAAVFGGGLPYEEYTFLVAFADQGRGGLEHRDCSLLLFPRTSLHARKGYEDFLGLIAHEHFHVWNVTRMRPAELWEPDLERENHTELLWVAEGFTAYYDDLLCRRAGVLSRERYLQILADNLGNCLTTPGRLLHPLANASFDAWIKLYRPDENTRNSTQSYYTNGALAALCIDLRIRDATDGARTLDDVMRQLWERTWQQQRGYTEQDVCAAVSAAAGTELGPFVRELVHAPFDVDFRATLATFGLQLSHERKDSAWLGVTMARDSMRVASVHSEGPAAEAGLLAGDEILAVSGLHARATDWQEILAAASAGRDRLHLLVARRGLVRELSCRVASDPIGKLKLTPMPDADERQQRLLAGWLGNG
jgi:predicted metalloprotease with PDZ domain